MNPGTGGGLGDILAGFDDFMAGGSGEMAARHWIMLTYMVAVACFIFGLKWLNPLKTVPRQG